MGDPGIRKNMQRVIWNYENEGDVNSSFKLRYDFDSPDVPQPSAYTLSTGSGIAVYGLSSSLYGAGVYGSSGANLVRQSVEGGGFTIALRVEETTTNQPISFKGYQLEFIPGGRR